MNEQILEYIKGQRIGVLATENLDGSPHAATIHFAHIDNPMRFIFLTGSDTKKCDSIKANGKCRASFVLGQDEETMKTLQMDGTVEFTTDESILNAYFQKFPNNKARHNPPETVILVFTPTWWRYSDMKAPGGKIIIENE